MSDILGGGADQVGGGSTDLSAYTGDVNITGNLAVSQTIAGSEATAGKVSAGDAGVTFGSAADTSLFRRAAAILHTDGVFEAGGTGIAASAKSVISLDGTNGISSVYENEANPRWRLYRDAGGAGKPGLLLGAGGATAPDTNLYRSAASVLKTDSELQVGGLLKGGSIVVANNGGSSQVQVGYTGAANGAAISFGSGLGDTNLYRSAADTLKTDDTFLAAGGQVSLNTFNVIARVGGGSQAILGVAGPTSEAGVNFGSAQDTNLYRSAADTLKTDDNLIVGSDFTLANTTAALRLGTSQWHLTVTGGSLQVVRSGIQNRAIFGDAASSVGLAVQGFASQTGNLQEWQDSTPTKLLAVDPVGKLVWGSAADTNLYRATADQLATDDDLLINLAGKGLRVKEGTNAKMGTATLVAGTVTVSTTAVTANSRIFVTNNTSGGTPGFLRISARTAGTSFTILSSSNTDTSTVAWFIVEPA